jgi:hypothetical protein
MRLKREQPDEDLVVGSMHRGLDHLLSRPWRNVVGLWAVCAIGKLLRTRKKRRERKDEKEKTRKKRRERKDEKENFEWKVVGKAAVIHSA